MPCTHGWGWPRDSRNTGGCVRGTGSSTAPCVRARAIELLRRGQADSAAAAYRAFAEVQRRAHDRSGRARTLAWRAEILRGELANYGEARDVLYEAQAEAETSHNLYAAAIVQLFLGQLFLSLNDHRTAAGYLDQGGRRVRGGGRLRGAHG